jgi:hypothetical protein
MVLKVRLLNLKVFNYKFINFNILDKTVRYNVNEKKNTSNKIPINNNGSLNLINNNTKNQKNSVLMNNLGNILNSNNINNKNETKNSFFTKNNNNQTFDENQKQMISTNSSMNFQYGTGINQMLTNIGKNKENINPINPQNFQMDQFQKLNSRTSIDFGSINDTSNNSLIRTNSNLSQIRPQNQIFNLIPKNNEMVFKQIENKIEGKIFNSGLNNNQNIFNQNNIINDNNDNCDANANQLFNELNLMYANNLNTNNSISFIPERDDKELNRLKENYFNISNKLKQEQRIFNKEGNNSLCGILQILKMVN